MIIRIPKSFHLERMYIIDVLFSEFLGLSYTIEISRELRDTVIEIGEKKHLVLVDYFFGNVGESYLHEKHIPTNLDILPISKYNDNRDLPIIFGKPKIEEISNNDTFQIKCHVDILASAFYMLTRWEELVVTKRDAHKRFSGFSSLAHKENFIDRPIVNEYLEILWKALEELSLSQFRKQRSYRMMLTHDIDIPLKWKNLKNLIKSLAPSIIRNKTTFKQVYQEIQNYIQSRFNPDFDPYNTFDRLMDISEQYKTQSYFFFLGSGDHPKYDHQNTLGSKFMKDLYSKIEQRGHHIGIHPTYNSFNDGKLLKEEFNTLSTVAPNTKKIGRQHFLRFEIPTTWQIWEDNQMLWDSTAGYADLPGFRCGTCYEFPVFNILSRQKLKLVEHPLIAMDSSFLNDPSTFSKEKVMSKLKSLVKTTKHYKGTFVLLWHNSAFNKRWAEIGINYEDLIDDLYYHS